MLLLFMLLLLASIYQHFSICHHTTLRHKMQFNTCTSISPITASWDCHPLPSLAPYKLVWRGSGSWPNSFYYIVFGLLHYTSLKQCLQARSHHKSNSSNQPLNIHYLGLACFIGNGAISSRIAKTSGCESICGTCLATYTMYPYYDLTGTTPAEERDFFFFNTDYLLYES